MTVLGIETSCDETAVAVLDVNKLSDIKVRANVVSSQIALHAQYGGVVPSLAVREHEKNISHVLETALKEAGISDIEKEIDLISVTKGPGLGPALLVGLSFARDLAFKHGGKALVGVDHMRGHIYSNWLNSDFKPEAVKFPILNLIVSGGHTELVLMSTEERNHTFELIGETMDDAVGEAFDKVARLLDLGYPGGPAISKRAEKWKLQNTNSKLKIKFPRPMEHSKDFNFSFSGLKTAVLYKVRDLKNASVKLTDDVVNEICFEFQNAAIDVLIQKTFAAGQKYKVDAVFLSGGVSANTDLRERIKRTAEEMGFRYSRPQMTYTTDNAAMIALAGYMAVKHGRASTDWQRVSMDANLHF